MLSFVQLQKRIPRPNFLFRDHQQTDDTRTLVKPSKPLSPLDFSSNSANERQQNIAHRLHPVLKKGCLNKCGLIHVITDLVENDLTSKKARLISRASRCNFC